MKITKLLALIALALIPQIATADVADSASRIAARAVSAPATKIAIKRSKNKIDFSGKYAGKAVFLPQYSNCSTIQSFLFRHIIKQNGANATLKTSHDGDFRLASRDKGRIIHGGKTIMTRQYGPVGVGVAYGNLKKGKHADFAIVGKYSNGCQVAFGGTAIAQK
jgi:hypothetical protein